jgi:putative membrane protein
MLTLHSLMTPAIVLTGLIYARGVRTVWRRAGVGRGVARWQAAAFATGLAALWVALETPLAQWAERAFTPHMAQHEILMLIAAPLLILGEPVVATLWALPARWRDRTATFVNAPLGRSAWNGLTHPFAAFALHAATLWIWHVPQLFDAAMASDAIHAVQHATFTLTAMLFWWGMLHGRYGRLAYGAGVLYVFLTAVHSSLLGALLTLAPHPWFHSYVERADEGEAVAMALADQQRAGLVMWIPSALVFIGLGLALTAMWLAAAGHRASLNEVRDPPPRRVPT